MLYNDYKMSYKSNIPNVLTSIRFLAGPIFFYTFLNDLFLISFFILILSGITDVLDGYVARNWVHLQIGEHISM